MGAREGGGKAAEAHGVDLRRYLCEERGCPEESPECEPVLRPCSAGVLATQRMRPVVALLHDFEAFFLEDVAARWTDHGSWVEAEVQSNTYRIQYLGERDGEDEYRIMKNELILYDRKKHMVYGREFRGVEELARHLAREFHRYVDPRRVAEHEPAGGRHE